MKGFRSSRAAQNSMSFRHGHPAQTALSRDPSQVRLASAIERPARMPVLPDWMKTPETRQLEKQSGSAPALPQAVLNTIAHMARSFEAKPQASAGKGERTAKVIPIAAARTKRAAAAPAAKKRAAVKAKSAKRAPTVRTAKRKAA